VIDAVSDHNWPPWFFEASRGVPEHLKQRKKIIGVLQEQNFECSGCGWRRLRP
jgi:hypothetical protein